jgi:2-polyprenyl-3-methyl-5-hydroxy-6-metoxy-1,4-benzoquinol methylase
VSLRPQRTLAASGALGASEAARYWEARARQFAGEGAGLAAVCSYGMPGFYNRAIALTQRRALAPWLRRSAHSRGAAALDVGCGVGRWSVALAHGGYRVTGVDLSPHMIEQARARAVHVGASCEFGVANAADLDLGRRFDLILCVTVLQHILDPSSARRAVANLAAHLAPRGQLVLLEAAPARDCRRCDSAVFSARPLEWYRGALRAAGLRLTAIRGVDPMPLKTWLLPHYARLPRALRLTALALATGISLPLDLALAPLASGLSWHKVIVACAAQEAYDPCNPAL